MDAESSRNANINVVSTVPADMEIPASGGLSRRGLLKAAASLAGAAAISGFAPLARAASAAGPVIETQHGRLRGEARDGVHVFRGVRYGESTGGANRFRPPPPVRPWVGVRDATRFGASAPQNHESLGAIETWYTTIEPISEDCLFLNVFAPAQRSANAKRPVMVWLHGGGWGSCAGTAPGFDGTRLARDGDVVVVTVNHRLNVFGYLYLGDKDERFADAGNAGMLDLVAALQWVRDNIATVGGDPANVTIFGQSGGAAKVASLMTMPAAHGLFHKAVIESCSGGMRLEQLDEAAQQAHALAGGLGLSALDGATLQALPIETLLGAMKAVKTPLRPVLDQRSFQQNPFDPTPSPVAKSVPLLIGNAATETTLYLSIDPRNLHLSADVVHRRLSALLKLDDTQTSHIEDAYRATLTRPTPSDVLAAVTSDYVFRRNTMLLAARQATQAPVYAYLFNWQTPVMGGLLHTPHTSEVPFVFGNLKEAAGLLGTGPELPQLSRDVMGAWVAFARNGDPDHAHLPHWPRYDATGQQTMILDVTSQVESDPGSPTREVLRDVPLYEYNVNRRSMLHG